MLNYIAIIVFITFVVGIVIALINLYMGSKNGGLAAHAERVATSHFDWKTFMFATVVLYVFLIATCAMIYTFGFGSFLLTFVALGVNMNMGALFHRGICLLIWKSHGAPVPMPV
jgi:uncharacterized membrane protein